MIKNSKKRSLAPLARTQMYSETRSLQFCHYMYSFLDIIYVNKGVEYWKQTLCNIMARKSIAGLPIIQVKGTWRSQGGIILGLRKNHQWLSEIPRWNIVHVVSFALSHLCISNNTEIWYIKCTLYYQYDVNSVNNNSRGSCKMRPYRNITFLRHEKYAFLERLLASLARTY